MAVIITDISGKHVTEVISHSKYYSIFQNFQKYLWISQSFLLKIEKSQCSSDLPSLNILIQFYFVIHSLDFCTQLKLISHGPPLWNTIRIVRFSRFWQNSLMFLQGDRIDNYTDLVQYVFGRRRNLLSNEMKSNDT